MQFEARWFLPFVVVLGSVILEKMAPSPKGAGRLAPALLRPGRVRMGDIPKECEHFGSQPGILVRYQERVRRRTHESHMAVRLVAIRMCETWIFVLACRRHGRKAEAPPPACGTHTSVGVRELKSHPFEGDGGLDPLARFDRDRDRPLLGDYPIV
ncbi:hypothetical protein [Kibdelosporangium philippinense]|uniref:hypothetical protein n=1 Tax=Kibdelosporangium philippinense TaxID=211113 RepID=UPI0036210E88